MPSTTSAPSVVEPTGQASAAGVRELPESLALSLRERARVIDSGALLRQDWQADAWPWSRWADTRYQACVDLRPPCPNGPDIRVGGKDTVGVAGFPTRLGLRHYRHHPEHTAAPLNRVPPAAITAKVVTTELNIGVGSGCRNPYFPAFDPAGSSSGSGVAVAAGICDLPLGTDVLGSVRWPAGRCGVVGLRTTHQPDRLGGVLPLSPAMHASGWMARTAADLAFCWDLLGLGGLPARRTCRIGVVREVFPSIDGTVGDGIERACRALVDGGHEVCEVGLGRLWDCRGAAWEMCSSDAWTCYRDRIEAFADDLHPSTIAAFESGARVSATRYDAIRESTTTERATVGRRFADHRVNAWLLPLDPTVPRRVTAGSPHRRFPIPMPRWPRPRDRVHSGGELRRPARDHGPGRRRGADRDATAGTGLRGGDAAAAGRGHRTHAGATWTSGPAEHERAA